MYKIGIDFTYVLDNEASGIRKAAEEIVDGILNLNQNMEIVLFVDERAKESFQKKYPKCKLVVMKFWFKNIKYIRRINIYRVSKIPKKYLFKKEKCDFIIYPYVNKLTPIIKKQKRIISILDVIPLDEIEDKNSKKYKKLKKEYINMMNTSKNIVTISNYSKKRLLELNPNYKGNIEVIPNSVEKLEKSNKDVSKIILTDKPYIFSINSFFKHKNQITLVKAFNLIKNQIPHNLILVGRPELDSGKSDYNNVQEYIEKNKLGDRIKILSYISDEDRNTLFYNTDLFVTTSLGEGFGRTPVEAALCKVPVISTKATSLPEATMNEVFYYENGTDEKELANKIVEVLNNKPTKERLEEIAKKMEEAYNKEKIANEYIKIIQEILGGKESAKN